MTEKIRFVLLNTTHPGNIGASARAIKNMGLEKLVLVNPANYPHPEALARSSGAEDILQKATIMPTLQQAISDCHVIIGTSARTRALTLPILNASDAAQIAAQAVQCNKNVAILFGQERMGLTNEQLMTCHYHLVIPCNAQFASLNLAAAVQIIAYELYVNLQQLTFTKIDQPPDLVTTIEMENFYQHLEKILISLAFLDPHNPRQLMRKLRRLFNRISLQQNEMNILRGILSAINKKISNSL